MGRFRVDSRSHDASEAKKRRYDYILLYDYHLEPRLQYIYTIAMFLHYHNVTKFTKTYLFYCKVATGS